MSFPYSTTEKEYIACNFCGKDTYIVLSQRGTDGLDLTSCMCRTCGLIYINPRMTKEGYGHYYEHEYRDKSIKHGDQDIQFNCAKLFSSTQVHGKELGRLMAPYMKVQGDIMEVGSGVGGVLSGMKSVLRRGVVGLEPSGQEARYAESQGIKTYHSLIEDHHIQGTYAAIVSTQSLNHFLDPHYFFRWAHDSLVEDGILVIEVMNFRQQLRYSGKYCNSVKIDHVYMFVPEVLKDFIRSAGFEILYYDTDEDHTHKKLRGIPHMHIRVIARRLPVKPFEDMVHTPDIFNSIIRSINHRRVYVWYLIHVRIPNLLGIS